MQNCLHSQKRVKMSRLLTAISVISAGALLCAIWLVCLKNGDVADFENPPVYLSARVESLPKISLDDSVKSVETKEKMNNEINKNAKIYISDENVLENTQGKETLVRVKLENGSVVQMQTEEYVLGCVLGEMPLTFESQALMAQSVAVRSFTYRRMLLGSSKHPEAHVCTDYRCCQSYLSPESVSVSEENLEKLTNAVKSTRGIVAVYQGEPIEAAYHASSGECTLDSEKVWGGKVEYLRSVKSPEGETDIYKNGYGHRVGMSQHGANILAGQGKSYIDIIKYYYSGVSLSFM